MNATRVVKAAEAIVASLRKRGWSSFNVKGAASLGVDAKLLLELDRALKAEPKGDVRTFYALVHPNHGEPGSSAPRLYVRPSTAVGASKQAGPDTGEFKVSPVTLAIPKRRWART